MRTFFYNTFQNMPTPVIVCELQEPHAIVFANTSVRLLMNPLLTIENLKDNVEISFLRDILRFQREEQYTALLGTLNMLGTVSDYHAVLVNYQDTSLRVSITANVVEQSGFLPKSFDGAVSSNSYPMTESTKYMVLYLYTEDAAGNPDNDINGLVETAFHIANQSRNVDEAINNVLAHAGNSVGVSRVYIFEEVSETLTSNTYEWCAPGVEPAIQGLQSLPKEDYNYDVIIKSEMYITDDIRDLPDNDREILEAQGIKSLAILSLVHAGKPLGYIGFDDCEHYRKWNSREIRLLMNMASIIVSLLTRRNFEQRLSRSRAILQTISDNIENIIYVNDIHTYEIVFLNKTLADTLGKPVDALIARKCWETLQQGQAGPCGFCPIPKMLEAGYPERGGSYTWEFQNTQNGKWYLLKDAIIKWIDGRDVHIETATEITHQKEYEEQLKFYASTDSLTGLHNREWGYKLIEEMMALPDTPENEASLVFIDLDGLKYVNDTYGHDAGDQMIRGVVDMLRANIRKSDVICRWGGDEFILLLKCGVEAARRIMRNVDAKLEAHNRRSGEPYDLAFSYGITELSKGPDATIDAVVTRADKLMYENKTAKRKGFLAKSSDGTLSLNTRLNGSEAR